MDHISTARNLIYAVRVFSGQVLNIPSHNAVDLMPMTRLHQYAAMVMCIQLKVIINHIAATRAPMIPVLLHVATEKCCIVTGITILNAVAQMSTIQIRNIAAIIMSYQRITGPSRNAAGPMDITPNLQSVAIIRYNQFQDILYQAAAVIRLMTLSIISAVTVTCILSER